MLFAHLKRILKLGRLRLRGPRGAQDEFTLAAIAQNLRRLAKLVVTATAGSRCLCGVAVVASVPKRQSPAAQMDAAAADGLKQSRQTPALLIADFCNKICQKATLCTRSKLRSIRSPRRRPLAM